MNTLLKALDKNFFYILFFLSLIGPVLLIFNEWDIGLWRNTLLTISGAIFFMFTFALNIEVRDLTIFDRGNFLISILIQVVFFGYYILVLDLANEWLASYIWQEFLSVLPVVLTVAVFLLLLLARNHNRETSWNYHFQLPS